MRVPKPLSNLPTLLRHAILSPTGRTLLVSGSLWLLAFTYCKFRYWRDPHSAFFSSEHVYDLKYSAYRQLQAEQFITQAGAGEKDARLGKAVGTPEICAAFVTVKRDTLQYINNAIGSLLEGLTVDEREKLWVHVLFANTDPTVHPSWKQPWLEKAVDSASGYNVSEEILDHLRELEDSRNFYEKGVFDYLYALRACYNTGASYVLMLEDDIIVADGWMAKTRQALWHTKSDKHGDEEFWNWIYLRLFFTETSMRWRDTDFWYYHMGLTIGLASLAGFIVLVLARHQFPSTRRHLDSWALAAICLVTIPSFVALFFMIGKYSLFPHKGVFKMNKYGCCTQALLFPQEQIPKLAAHLEAIGHGQTDTMIEEYADVKGMERLALGPQQVQHVGLQSSRDNTFVNSQSTWAFWFEEYDPERLRREHIALLGG